MNELDRYEAIMYDKFGANVPALDAICRYCGESFGNHAGHECPIDNAKTAASDDAQTIRRLQAVLDMDDAERKALKERIEELHQMNLRQSGTITSVNARNRELEAQLAKAKKLLSTSAPMAWTSGEYDDHAHAWEVLVSEFLKGHESPVSKPVPEPSESKPQISISTHHVIASWNFCPECGADKFDFAMGCWNCGAMVSPEHGNDSHSEKESGGDGQEGFIYEVAPNPILLSLESALQTAKDISIERPNHVCRVMKLFATVTHRDEFEVIKL